MSATTARLFDPQPGALPGLRDPVPDARAHAPPAARRSNAGPELSVIVPTRNEVDNVAPLVAMLSRALADLHWEAIFVDDDSNDGTLDALRALGQRDRRVRVIHRIGRRGLSSACIEGIQASTAPYVAVMDADGQHDETLLPRMLASLRAGEAEVVVGSRYVEGGDVHGWGAERARLSTLATRLSRMVLRAPVADPMSGFFMLPREVFDAAVRRLSGIGFKILVDVLASAARPLAIKELPYHFRERNAGESKLDTLVAVEYLVLLLDKLVGHLVPVRFALFSMVGALGVGVHLAVLYSALALLGPAHFVIAQGLATGTAMIGNFSLNNLLTHRDRRLRGLGFARGLASFCAVCGVGAIANLGVASFLFNTHGTGWALAGLAGAAMSAVWNYALSSVVTWKKAG